MPLFAPTLLAWRFSRARHGQRFTRFINRFALAGIVVGTAALIIVGSVMNGFETELKQRILGVVPQLTVSSTDREPLSNWQQLRSELPVISGQQALVPQVSTAGVIQAEGRLRPVLLQGIFPADPESQRALSAVRQHLVVGRFEPTAGDYEIVLGQALAQELDVWPGDRVRLIAAGGGVFTPLGLVPAQRQFTVIGIVAMQSEADSQLLLLHGADVARLLRMATSQVTELRYYFDDPFMALPAQQQLSPWFAENQPGLTSLSWREAYGELFDAVALEKRMVSLMLGLIIAVAAFNIVSALMMMIQDKRADIAILQTMGMRRRGIQCVFFMQGIHNGVMGSLFGLVLGLAGSWWMNDILRILGIDMSLVGGTGLPVVIEVEQIVWILTAACLLSIVATLYPAWRASRILPAQALRYE